MFANHISDKGLISGICKEHLYQHNKKITTLRMGKGCEQIFLQGTYTNGQFNFQVYIQEKRKHMPGQNLIHDYGSMSHRRQKMETSQMLIDRQMGKQNMLY